MLDAALELLDKGYSVVPCAPGERYPTIPWREYQSRLPTPDELRAWWKAEPHSNVAIITGAVSGILVLDIDGHDGLTALAQAGVSLPPTRIIKTPHGWHAYYHYVPGIPSRAGVYAKVDVKNDGGCVCSPPSVVAAGTYTVFRDVPIAPVGLDPAVLCGESERTKRATRDWAGKQSWLSKAIQDGAPKGERNDTGARLAGYLRSKGIPQDVAVALLTGYADRCEPPMPHDELEHIVASAWRYKPSPSLDSVYGGEA